MSSKKPIKNTIYRCEICKTEYSCRQNLWKHNKISHDNQKPSEITPKNEILDYKSSENPPKNEILDYKPSENPPNIFCDYCQLSFSRKDNLNRHLKICKEKEKKDLETNILKEQNICLKQELEEIKKQLKIVMNTVCKIHPKTFNKLNKNLNSNNNSNNTTTNSNNTNTINNTINIVALGHEELEEIFSELEKKKILKQRYNSLNYLINYVHFNYKYPQFRNILITNTQNSIAFKFDNKSNKFIAINKDALLDDLINERMSDIEMFYDEVKDKLDERTKEIIEKFINNMDTDEEFIEKKKKEIKLIIYNNRDLVSKDLEIIV
jgi:hypothetical protein